MASSKYPFFYDIDYQFSYLTDTSANYLTNLVKLADMKTLYLKLTEQPRNRIFGLVIIAYSVFFLIILFLFIPTSASISKTGYSTSDLQQATSSEQVERILSEWQEVILVVYLQYLGDYIFLTSGLLGNCGIFVLLGREIKKYGSIILPYVGFITVFLSRGSDVLENTLTMILITFPDSYPRFILSILPLVPIIKFTFVGIVYSLIIVNLIYYILLKRKYAKSSTETP
jgi:hypothetical protein